MCSELTMRVVAEVTPHDVHPVEVLRALTQVAGQSRAHTRFDRDGRERVVAVPPKLEADLPDRDVQKTPEGAQLSLPQVSALRKVGLPDLHGQSRNVRHQDVPVAVEDRPTRPGDPNVATLVVLRGAQQLLAVQDLERPEPEE